MRKQLQSLIIRLVLSIVVVSIITVGTVYAENNAYILPKVFADVKEGFWGKKAIDIWSGHGVIQGDGVNFYPDEKITRAEMAVILDRIFGFDKTVANPYVDIGPGDWYYTSLIKAYARGIMLGSFDSRGKRLARPNDPLTRAEAAVLFTRVFSVKSGTGIRTNFRDTDIPAWAVEDVYAMEASGYIKGKGNGFFDPSGSLTRAEAVQILENVVKLYASKPGSYSTYVKGSAIINTSDVVMKDMKINGNLYLTEGIGSGKISLINVVVTGSTFVRGGGTGKVFIENCELGILVIEKAGVLIYKTQPDPDPITISDDSRSSADSEDLRPEPVQTSVPVNIQSVPVLDMPAEPVINDVEEDLDGGNMSTY